MVSLIGMSPGWKSTYTVTNNVIFNNVRLSFCVCGQPRHLKAGAKGFPQLTLDLPSNAGCYFIKTMKNFCFA